MFPRRPFAGVVVLAAALAAPGCFELEAHTKLQADGAGEMQLAVGLTEGMVTVMREMEELDPSSDLTAKTAEITFERPDAAELAEMEKLGMHLLEFEGENSKEKVYSRFRVGFDRPAALAGMSRLHAKGQPASSGPGAGLELRREADGTYVLRSAKSGSGAGGVAEDDDAEVAEVGGGEEPTEEHAGAAEEDPAVAMEKAAKAMELLGKMLREASKLKLSLSYEVPGEIVSYEPQRFAKQEGSKVTWTIDWEALQKATREGGASPMGDGFSVRFRMPEGTSLPESALTPAAAVEAEGSEGAGRAEPGGDRR